MAAEQFFTKVVQDVLEASEKLVVDLENGMNLLLSAGGAQRSRDDTSSSSPSPSVGQFFHKEGISDDELDVEEELKGSPLMGIAEGVIGDIMKGQAGAQSPLEHFNAFRSAITWSEPFIQGLVAFHIVMFFLTIYISRPQSSLASRIALMVFIAALVRSAETLNYYANQHWKTFATQNYFDQRGIFMSIMLCAPLLLDSMIMLLFFLREASKLLVQVKREEIRRKRTGQAKNETKAPANVGKARRAKKEQ